MCLESKPAYMSRLKNLLQSDAGQFLHVGFLLLTYIYSKTSYLAIGLFCLEIVFLFKKSKRLVIYGLVLILITSLRFSQIESVSQITKDQYQGKIISVEDQSFVLRSELDLICYLDDTTGLTPGMVVVVKGSLWEPSDYQIMNTFDYQTYLRSIGIEKAFWVDSIDVISIGFDIHQISMRISQYIDNNFIESSSYFLHLFILGERLDWDGFDSNQANQLGITHLFAISGMHLGLLVGFLSWVLKKFYWTKETNRILILIFLIVYNVITGFKISIVRASLLVTGIYLIDTYQILLSKTDLITFSMIGFLLYNPYIAYHLGFQLSYLIVLALMLASTKDKQSSFWKRTIHTTWIATLFSLPITLSVNHEFGLVFLYANLCFIVYVAYVFLPVSFLTVFLPILEPVYQVFVSVFLKLMQLFDSINVVISFSFPNQLYFLLYYGIVVSLFLFWRQYKRRLILLLSMLVLLLVSWKLPYESNRFVRFFDVGQGDAIQIHDNGCDLLIDTGNSDGYDTLIEYFHSVNLHHLDYLIITHLHADHYGETNDILNEIEIDHLYLNQQSEAIIGEAVWNEGDVIFCGTSQFQVLSAYSNDTNENNNSLVIYGLIGGDRYLFTGDIESEQETSLLDKYSFSIDVLKVAHHGSSTSSTETFLTRMNPEMAIISVGKNNSYGQPDEEVLERIENHSNSIYRTDESGTITIYYYSVLHLRVVETYRHHTKRNYTWTLM